MDVKTNLQTNKKARQTLRPFRVSPGGDLIIENINYVSITHKQ
jgi:hypothetical protein